MHHHIIVLTYYLLSPVAMMVLQLKSTQKEAALLDISSIIRSLAAEFGQRIKGHEIHQTRSVMDAVPIRNRASTVSKFCSQNEIRYLAYHAPILGRGQNVWEEQWREKVNESIAQTIREVEMIRKEVDLARAVVVFHLTNYVHSSLLPRTWQEKLQMYRKAAGELARSLADVEKSCILAVENTYPRLDGSYANVGPFHPEDLAGMQDYGFGVALDLAHYQLYSNYLSRGRGNPAGDVDRERYVLAPSWDRCMEALAGSLVLLHISDARGLDVKGEGLPLGKGEIPVAAVLKAADQRDGILQGTIELNCGHVDGSRAQLDAARQLFRAVPGVFGPA